ncbi:MAG: histidine kinase dimerization/phospho-acceptor domain-containing protein, partial [Bacteroidota bacterium]
QAQKLAIKIGFKKGEARALNLIAIIESMHGNAAKAFELNRKALKIGEELNDSWVISFASNDMAIYYSEIVGDQESAMVYYLKAVQESQRNNDTILIVISSYNLSFLNKTLSNKNDRRKYLEKAYNFGKHSSDSYAKALGFYSKSVWHETYNAYDSIIYYSGIALDISKEADNKIIELSATQAIANAQLGLGYGALSIITLNKAAKVAKELGRESELFVHTNLIRNYNKIGNYDKASSLGLKILNQARALKETSIIKAILRELAHGFEKQNDFASAYKYKSYYQALQDSLYNTDRMQQANKYQANQRQKENELLLLAKQKDDAIIKQKTTQNRSISIISILVGALTVILFLAYRARVNQVKKMEERILERTSELEQSNLKLKQINEELEQFAYISSHDLKQPLRNILDFVGLLKKRKSDQLDKDANKYLDIISNSSSRLDELINDILYFSGIGKKDAKKQILDCNEIIKNVISDLDVQIKEKKAKINSGYLPKIEGYKSEIHALFQN